MAEIIGYSMHVEALVTVIVLSDEGIDYGVNAISTVVRLLVLKTIAPSRRSADRTRPT